MARISALLTERSTRHALTDRRCTTVAEAAALTVAIQAQDAPASRLGIRARTAGVTESDVVAAVEDTRTVTRTWLMRGTIHLVDTRDVRWLVRLIGPAIERKYRTRWRQVGLADDLLERVVAALPEVLRAGPLTRREIRDALHERGITIDSPDPQAHTHAVLHASTTGLICRATDRGRDATFALLEDWVPPTPAGPSGDDALAELARRYFQAFSPATAADFASWSGLGAARPIGLIRDLLTEVEVDGRAGFRLGELEPQRGVRLLPAFDNYLLGYVDREAILTSTLRDRVYQGGMIRPTVLVDGAVVGTWSLRRSGPSPGVHVEPFAALPKRVGRAIEQEAEDLARFLERPMQLTIEATY